jgi:hypothetical protein
LVESPGSEHHVHPFKKYQKRRGGKVGQIFGAAFYRIEDPTRPIYDGEIMLAGWGDTERGQSVKFWLDNEASLHPFAGLRRRAGKELGQFFAVAMTLVDDSGGPAVDRDIEDTMTRPGQKRRSLSQDAYLIITSDRFCQFLREKCEYTAVLDRKGRAWDGPTAKNYVKWRLSIESLGDLDRSADAAKRFHEEIRIPYSRWNGDE